VLLEQLGTLKVRNSIFVVVRQEEDRRSAVDLLYFLEVFDISTGDEEFGYHLSMGRSIDMIGYI
jgi:hypothetical protein